VLFGSQDADAATAALRRALAIDWSPDRLAAHADGFSAATFLDRMEAIVDEELARGGRRAAA
jgi:hypothetical protein